MHDVRQYVFLVGGLGRRLGVHTRSCAKHMLEVDGVPFIAVSYTHLTLPTT